MNKNELIQKAYNRSHLLTLKNEAYRHAVNRDVFDFYHNDISEQGDITTQFVVGDDQKKYQAIIQAKEDGIISGIEEVKWFYDQLLMHVKIFIEDGQPIKAGDNLIEITGTFQQLLATERTGLNCLQRMSGIATTTHKLLEKIKPSTTKIAGSRKTAWYLDNKAVDAGGGLTHRLGLWDAVMIKDNHLKALELQGINDPFQESILRAWQHKDATNFIEIEATNIHEAQHVAEVFHSLKPDTTPCIIMLDNFIPAEVNETIQLLNTQQLLEHIIIECSGNIHEDNIAEYAKYNPDIISIGALTHSVKALDIHQTIIF